MTWLIVAAVALAAVVLLLMLRKLAMLVVIVCLVGFVCDQANVDLPVPKALSDIQNKLDNNSHNLACSTLAQQALTSDDPAVWNQLETKCPEVLKQSKQAAQPVLDEG